LLGGKRSAPAVRVVAETVQWLSLVWEDILVVECCLIVCRKKCIIK
jgi:hypothetical protein